MTKRDFDIETKQNYGERMPSDTRRSYRQERLINDTLGFIDRRARAMTHRNLRYSYYSSVEGRFVSGYANSDGFLPTLAAGSKWRSVAAFRRDSSLPLLG